MDSIKCYVVILMLQTFVSLGTTQTFFNISSCVCTANEHQNTSNSNYTYEELKTILAPQLQELQKELSVEVESLSNTINKRKCAKDSRPSSQNLGVVGALVIGGLFSCIIISDVIGCIAKSQKMKKRSQKKKSKGIEKNE